MIFLKKSIDFWDAIYYLIDRGSCRLLLGFMQMKSTNYVALMEHDRRTGKYGVVVPDIPGFSTVGGLLRCRS